MRKQNTEKLSTWSEETAQQRQRMLDSKAPTFFFGAVLGFELRTFTTPSLYAPLLIEQGLIFLLRTAKNHE
jgi:hypothetical protein